MRQRQLDGPRQGQNALAREPAGGVCGAVARATIASETNFIEMSVGKA